MEPGLHVIGWKEYVDFVDWQLRRVKTKIDTGARTSALGVLSYELHDDLAGGKVVTFRIAPQRRHPERVQEIAVPLVRMVVVSNSAGMREQRPLVETTLRLGPVTKRVRLTITNRMGMRFAMILGRKALEGDFLVDVSRKYLLKKAKGE
ncbi:MAG TPA: RimK/LysX family protein [Gemmataceae bacterium]|nr:RimK/LysX family protein [Gemmataceae bacterium]